MAEKNGRSEDVKTPLAIVSYARDLFEARERGDDDDNKRKGYGCTLIFKKGVDMTALHAAALEAATGRFGDKAAQLIKDEIIKSPFLDGDGKQGKTKDGEQKEELRGSWFIRCSSGEDYKPKVFDRKRLPVMTVEGCPSGSQVYAVVNAFAWENKKQGKGISFGVSMVQVVKAAEGDEVLGGGGGPDPDKFFDKIEDEGEAPASTKSGAGAAGLFG